MESNNQLPKARKDNLIVKELDDETLVYDRANDQAHCLNRTSALVWRLCDGETSVNEITRLLSERTNSVVDEAIVWHGIDQLEKFQLLDTTAVKPAHLAGLNRRDLMRRVGLAALAIPVIVSVTALPAQAQGSCRAPGVACGSNNQCCSTQCCGSPGVPPCPINNVCV